MVEFEILLYYFREDEIRMLRNLDDLTKARYMISTLFKDKKDKSGNPYIGHLIRVSSNDILNKDTYKIAALMHDTVEDIPYMTFDVLKYLNFSNEVINIVRLVTKTNGVSYEDEINNIIKSKNEGALFVKYADMSDNLNEDRLALLDNKTSERLKRKYSSNYNKLRTAILFNNTKNFIRKTSNDYYYLLLICNYYHFIGYLTQDELFSIYRISSNISNMDDRMTYLTVEIFNVLELNKSKKNEKVRRKENDRY